MTAHVAARTLTPQASIPEAVATPPSKPPAMSARTKQLLEGRIVPTLLALAWPNILMMMLQASTGLIETWWVSHLGTEALTGMALVFPGYMMMTMLSAGAFGGGIASAIARALGADRRDDADALVLHAIISNGVLGLLTSAIFLVWGRDLYAAMGGRGASLDAAMTYSNVVFGGTILVWVMNALASAIRATGNMVVPSLAICASVIVLVPLSPLLIFGWGPVPALGIAGGGWAIVVSSMLSITIVGLYVLSGRCVVRLRPSKLRWPLFADMLGVGAVGAVSTLQTSLTILLVTALVGTFAGPDAIAGYGTAVRLEYLLVPLTFGLGAPLVALVGTNIGAGQQSRALRIALVGAAIAFASNEVLGLAAAIFPHAWLTLFGEAPGMLDSGITYLHYVGPLYGFFGLGLALYFASQGAGRLGWPLIAGLMRMIVAAGGGWLALRMTGSLIGLFAVVGFAMVVYGVTLTAAVASGVWFRPRHKAA